MMCFKRLECSTCECIIGYEQADRFEEQYYIDIDPSQIKV